MRRLAENQLRDELARYQAALANGADPEARRVAEARVAEIQAELKRRNRLTGSNRVVNRWPHVDLLTLFQEFGASLRPRKNGKVEADHSWRHGSRSGRCVVIWPEEGRWYCASCKAGGDAAALVADHDGVDYKEACRRLKERFGPPPSEYEHLPWIDASEQNLRVIAPQAWDALCRANEPAPFLFRFGGGLVRLERDDHGRLRPAELDPDRLTHHLARVANFFRTRADGGRIIVRPPAWLVKDLLATPDPPLPVLERVVSVPVFARAGQLVDTPGYHSGPRIYYDPAPGLEIPLVPEHPTDADIARARELLLGDLLVDFPFVSEADRAHAVALILLPFARELIQGPTPLHVVESPCQGSGKTLLVKVCLLPGLGRWPAPYSTGRDRDEWRKAITAALRDAPGAVWFDNLKERLDSGDLAQALTATLWRDRVLGRSESIELPVRCVWVLTGNNPDLAGDIPRRCVRIRLDPQVEWPWLRTNFKHSPLEAWAWNHRGELAWAALTLVRAWLDRGRPAWDGVRLGSFEAWAEVMGGILQAADISGFLGNLEEFYTHVDPEGTAWRAFVAAWWEKFEDKPVLARELVPLAEASELVLNGKDGDARSVSLGRRLERMRGRVISGCRIEKCGTEHRIVRWRLHKIEPTEKNPTTPTTPTHPPGETQAGDAKKDSEPPRESEPPAGDGAGMVGVVGVVGVVGPVQKIDDAPAYRLVTETADLNRVVAGLASAQVLGLDCETTGLDPHADRLRLIQLASPGGPVYLVDCFAVDPRALGPVLQGARLLIGHNLKFDLRFLMAAGLPIPEGARLFDTMLGGQLLDETAAPPGLKELAAGFLGLKLEKELQKADWSGTLSPAMLEYAARDAAVLPPLYQALARELEAAGLGRAAELEFRALPAVAWLEHTGAPFDTEGWRAVCDRALAAKLEAVENLNALADRLGVGPEINWDSPQQVLHLLRAAGVPVDDTREESLTRHRDHPLVAALLAYREAARRCGNYGLDWLGYVHPVTGRIHADWRQIGAASGRMACRDPNLQNIPRDPQYRACFRPGPGRVLVKADYSQIELRIAAELSGDRRLLEAFSRGEDLHILTAALVLGRSPGAVTGEDRRLAKAINFGLLYGMGPRAFAEHAQAAYGVGLTEAEAARLRERFFQAYPGLKAWHRRARGDGPVEVRTASGRRRVVNSFTERLNTPVQGTGADGLKLALALLWETRDRCPGAAPVLAVHDEVVVEVPEARAEEALAWVRDCMVRGMGAFLTKVPVEVEAAICRDWAGAGPSP